ncbi:LysE family translocator [Staphylococcus sp. Marseille-Q5304]|uniref:LysE family translocator n=1 Tax=Staphylococcus sp. Marseille-Q5304 TaxID=2942200 RepID=UPI002073F11F|nr:LysE family translocator [Staphylococcus sp. Marseille-Q5304]
MDQLISFFAIALMIIIVPGPDFFIVLNNSISGRPTNGIFATLGITTAHLIYSLFAALGLIFILSSSYYIFTGIKLLGALYIIFLGIKTILGASKKVEINQNSERQYKIKYLKSYRQGLLSTILNPKIILFYVSVLPQFITQQDGTSKLLFLSGAVILMTLVWYVLCSFIFNYINFIFNNSKFKAVFDYLVGLTLIIIAISLLKVQKQ